MKFPEKLTERMHKARTMSTIAYFQKEWGVKESREVVLTSKMKSVAWLLISPLAHNFYSCGRPMHHYQHRWHEQETF